MITAREEKVQVPPVFRGWGRLPWEVTSAQSCMKTGGGGVGVGTQRGRGLLAAEGSCAKARPWGVVGGSSEGHQRGVFAEPGDGGEGAGARGRSSDVCPEQRALG